MMKNPGRYIRRYAECGINIMYIHPDSEPIPTETLAEIRELGIHPGIVINPGISLESVAELFPLVDYVLVMTVNPGFAGQQIVPHTIEKTARVRKLLDELGHPEVYIESDGNITCENAAKLYKNGSDIFVGGTSSIFREGDIDELIMNLRKAIGW